MKKFRLGNKIVGLNYPPFIVAEMSANHNGSISQAKKIINAAKKSGADAIKLQTYEPSTMTIKSSKSDFRIKNGIWKGKQLWDLYKKGHTPFSWHKELFSYAKKKKILCFSTPFDETAVDLLEKINCPFYKIASFEMNDIPLVSKIAKTKKPVIISTGTANLKEIEFTIKTAKKFGAKKIILLYCVSAYPAKLEDFNLNNIKILQKKFNLIVGLSDHSNDNAVACSAVLMGARVIEKHIVLNNQKKGLDYDFSLKEKKFKKLKLDLLKTWKLIGSNSFYRSKNELKSKIFRRSIYVVKNIKKGEKFTKENIRRIRPGFGLEPKFYNNLLKRKSKKNIQAGTAFKKSFIL